MPSYIAPEYEVIENTLTSFIEEHELDKVTVNSLIRGSIEVLEPELPTASVAVIDTGDLASSVDIKPRNIRVNLKFALNSIFSFKPICDESGAWLVLAILNAILSLIKDMKMDLNKEEAVVLFALYRLQRATSDEIGAYINKLKENGESVDIQNSEVQDALGKLEKLKTIKLEDGKFCLCETILIRKS